MWVLAVVGHSGSGKTRLIQRLVPEIRKRGRTVAVIKRCHRGFELDRGKKDSDRFLDAGSEAVGLWAPDRCAVVQRSPLKSDFLSWVERCFSPMDVVIIEGGKHLPGVPKIEVRGGHGAVTGAAVRAAERMAVVAEAGEASDVPVFSPDQSGELADFILSAATAGDKTRA
jgi:molybdopterin-guanine dinucleotide biosynthesis protein B